MVFLFIADCALKPNIGSAMSRSRITPPLISTILASTEAVCLIAVVRLLVSVVVAILNDAVMDVDYNDNEIISGFSIADT